MNAQSKTKPAAGRSPRNGLIAKIHAMKRELALDDDSYRDLVERVTGKRSCKTLGMAQLEAVKDEFVRLGAGKRRKAPPRRAGARRMVTGGQASKIRALWLSLYHLGEVDDPAESALAAFVMRTTGIEALDWLGPDDADKAIRALRGWCKRVGFEEPDAAKTAEIDAERRSHGLMPVGHGFAAKLRLIEFQCERVRTFGITPKQQDLLGIQVDADDFSPLRRMDPRIQDVFIERLGAWLRRMKEESADQTEEKPCEP